MLQYFSDYCEILRLLPSYSGLTYQRMVQPDSTSSTPLQITHQVETTAKHERKAYLSFTLTTPILVILPKFQEHMTLNPAGRGRKRKHQRSRNHLRWKIHSHVHGDYSIILSPQSVSVEQSHDHTIHCHSCMRCMCRTEIFIRSCIARDSNWWENQCTFVYAMYRYSCSLLYA